MSVTVSSDERRRSGTSLPAVTLTVLGTVISVLGLFVAGDMVIVSIGLGAIFAGGLIEIGTRFIERNRSG